MYLCMYVFRKKLYMLGVCGLPFLTDRIRVAYSFTALVGYGAVHGGYEYFLFFQQQREVYGLHNNGESCTIKALLAITGVLYLTSIYDCVDRMTLRLRKLIPELKRAVLPLTSECVDMYVCYLQC